MSSLVGWVNVHREYRYMYTTIAAETYETQALIEASDDERRGSLNAIGTTCETLTTPLCGETWGLTARSPSSMKDGCTMTTTKSTSHQ